MRPTVIRIMDDRILPNVNKRARSNDVLHFNVRQFAGTLSLFDDRNLQEVQPRIRTELLGNTLDELDSLDQSNLFDIYVFNERRCFPGKFLFYEIPSRHYAERRLES